MATLVMPERGTKAVEVKAENTATQQTGGLSLVRGILLMLVTAGVCEMILVAGHVVAGRILGR